MELRICPETFRNYKGYFKVFYCGRVLLWCAFALVLAVLAAFPLWAAVLDIAALGVVFKEFFALLIVIELIEYVPLSAMFLALFLGDEGVI